MTRGKLRVYLGAAPGVGKTYAMLDEGRRRAGRGTDVVIGFMEDHRRALTRQMAEGLEVVPRRTMTYRGATFTEMDLDAVLARHPQVALVDELAHTNAPGSCNAKRWQDIEELLAAGIDVISTVNIQHLESLNDVTEQITGVKQRETVPDEVVRRADQIELADMSAEALRRRMAHGNIYPPEKIDAAMANYFRAGNLTALRELALLWVADRVDEVLQRYRGEHDIKTPWPTRERVVVALSGGPEGETLIRRGARIASRAAGGELLAVYVARSDGLVNASPENLARQRALVESLAGSYHMVVGDDVAEAVLDFARAVNATQIVIGASRRSRLKMLLSRGVGAAIVDGSGESIDVYVVTHEEAAQGRLLLWRRAGGTRRSLLGRRRRAAAWVLAVIGPWLLTAALANTRPLHALPINLLLYLTLTIGVALIGGLWPALIAAVTGSLLANYYFTPPLYTFTIANAQNALALIMFVVVAIAVSSVVDLAARRTVQAAQAKAEADTLSTLAGSILRGEEALPAVLRLAQEAFGMTSVTLLERSEGHGTWRCLASSGEELCLSPEAADSTLALDDRRILTLRGRALPAEQQRVLAAFATQVTYVLERQRLRDAAAEAERLAEGNKIRTALLAAVSHDLRTPLAGIKAAVSSLRQQDLDLSPEDQAELLALVEEGADRLDRLVANLLDLSRLQTRGIQPLIRAVSFEEVVPAAIDGVPGGDAVRLDVPETLPAVVADPGLLERVIANIVDNAVKHTPAGTGIVMSAGVLGDHVELRVADRGPGVPDADKERIFGPFQRHGDAPAGLGVGLGLAVARGFAEAMGGTLVAEDTPGGGLTMVLSLPCAQGLQGASEPGQRLEVAP